MHEATKVGNVVTQVEGLPIIKSHDHLNKWLYEVTWKTLNLIYPNTYSHQTCQNGDLLREAHTRIVLITWSCDFDFLLCDL